MPFQCLQTDDSVTTLEEAFGFLAINAQQETGIRERGDLGAILETEKWRTKIAENRKTEIEALTDKASVAFRNFLRLNLFYLPKFLLPILSSLILRKQKKDAGCFPRLLH